MAAIDAILCPDACIPPGNDDVRAAWAKRTFGAALGNPRYVFMRKTDGGCRLIFGANKPHDASLHDRRYEDDGGERYAWTPQPEGWATGVLADAPAAPPPAAAPAPAFAAAPTPTADRSRLSELANKPNRTQADIDELNSLIGALRR